jgi:putative ABC transport system permease protein
MRKFSCSILLTHTPGATPPAIVTQAFLDHYHKTLGDTFDVHIGTGIGAGRTLRVRVVGMVPNTGIFVSSDSMLLVSLKDYTAANPQAPVFYDGVDIAMADQAHMDQAVGAIQAQFPFANTQSTVAVLNMRQRLLNTLKRVRDLAGLLTVQGLGAHARAGAAEDARIRKE